MKCDDTELSVPFVKTVILQLFSSILNDVSQMASNRLTHIDELDLGRAMGEYGHRQIHDYFTPQRMADDMERVYRQVLNRSG